MYEAKTVRAERRNRSTIIAVDMDIPFSVINTTSRQKISKDTEELSSTINN